MVQTVKNLPMILEPRVQFQSWEDPLQKGVATHSIILAWRILCVHGVTKSDTTEQLTHTHWTVSEQVIKLKNKVPGESIALNS